MGILIYKAERDAGLEELIKASASIAYFSPAIASENNDQIQQLAKAYYAMNCDMSMASEYDGDLYPNRSILATTNWNLNDDVFDPLEVWVARNTPSHKPDNIDHDETKIVGHMIGAWPINLDGSIIPDTTSADELPQTYHLVNNSVIYRNWQDASLKQRAEDLIEAIKANEMFVSMECLFNGFDYAIKTPGGENHILARSSETAFLTKHLRAYKGTGEYEGNKVGRLMRNIVFSAKGYVRKPANPASIIFADINSNNFANASKIDRLLAKTGVSILCNANFKNEENSNMAGENDTAVKTLESQVAQLSEALKASQAENKALAEKMVKEEAAKSEKTIADLNTKVNDTTSKLTAANTELETLKTSKTALETQLAEANKVKAELEKQVAETKVATLKATRISTLVTAGVAQDVATSTVEKFISLSDEQFAVIAELAAKAAKMDDDDEEDDDDDKGKKGKKGKKDDKDGKADAGAAAAKVLDTAKPNKEAALSTAGASETDTGKTRQLLSKALAHRLSHGSSTETEE